MVGHRRGELPHLGILSAVGDPGPVAALDYVRRLHAVVDELVAPLTARHGPRLACRAGCAGCCVDELTVFEVEAERIRVEFPEVLASAPGPAGRCALLDEGGRCRVYTARPYVCRTQGLPLRWAESGVERRDICPMNEAVGSVEALDAAACWTLGPFEQRLQAVQAARDGGVGRRVALRALFGG